MDINRGGWSGRMNGMLITEAIEGMGPGNAL